jgi:hypothetical protein
MHGTEHVQDGMFSCVSLEQRAPQDHPFEGEMPGMGIQDGLERLDLECDIILTLRNDLAPCRPEELHKPIEDTTVLVARNKLLLRYHSTSRACVYRRNCAFESYLGQNDPIPDLNPQTVSADSPTEDNSD